jgi:hypothetical protein
MTKEFDLLLDSLDANERKILEDIYKKKILESQAGINEEIERDNQHLELVNICYNLFTRTTETNKMTGYKVVLVDPLCTLNIKIFDLMLFNDITKNAILIEAKSSISERKVGSEVDETTEAAKQALSNLEKLQEFIGSKIAKLEFAVLSYAYYADLLKAAIIAKNASMCLWAYHAVPGIIQMLAIKDDVLSEKSAGRMHFDEDIRQTLLKAIPTKMGALRSLPIMPTSHMFTKLEYIAQQLFTFLDKQPRDRRWFRYSEVFSLCKQAFSSSELGDSELEQEARKIIAAAIEADLFQVINDEDDISLMEFEIPYNRRNYEKFKEDYAEKHTQEKASIAAIEQFKQQKGFRKLEDFGNR